MHDCSQFQQFPKRKLLIQASMKDFRASLRVAGQPLSKTVSDLRDEERYWC